MFTSAEILEMVRAGVSASEIVELQRASASAGAASHVTEAPKGNAFYRDVIVGKAPDRAARRALAAEMRASGVEPTGAAWKKAKKAAGIK